MIMYYVFCIMYLCYNKLPNSVVLFATFKSCSIFVMYRCRFYDRKYPAIGEECNKEFKVLIVRQQVIY